MIDRAGLDDAVFAAVDDALGDIAFAQAGRAGWTAAAGDVDVLATTVAGFAQHALRYEDDSATAHDPAGFPGFSPFARGRTPSARAIGGWDARQEVRAPSPADANAELHAELLGGAASVTLRFDCATQRLDWSNSLAEGGLCAVDVAQLRAAVAGVDPKIAPLALDAGAGAFVAGAQLCAALRRPSIARAEVRVAPCIDPVGALARDGRLPQGLNAAYDDAAAVAAQFSATSARSIAALASDAPFHDAGANDALAAAAAVSGGVAFLRAAERRRSPLDYAARQLVLQVSVGPDALLGAAKIRALRMVWGRVAALAGVSPVGAGARVHAVTAARIMTRRDPWTNMIRTAAAAFGAAIGGADVVTTRPYEQACGAPTAFGRRIARNLHHLLMGETQAHRVIDPAGGSWSVEAAANDMAAAIWRRFQIFERLGGVGAALLSGAAQEMVAADRARLIADVVARRTSIVGVSRFAALDQAPVETARYETAGTIAAADRAIARGAAHILAPIADRDRFAAAVDAFAAGAPAPAVAAALYADADPIACAPLAPMRLSDPFEALRDRVDALPTRPVVAILRAADDRQAAAQAAWACDAYAAAGLDGVIVDAEASVPESAAAVALCGDVAAPVSARGRPVHRVGGDAGDDCVAGLREGRDLTPALDSAVAAAEAMR